MTPHAPTLATGVSTSGSIPGQSGTDIRPTRRALWLLAAAIALLVLLIFIALHWLLRPEFATRLMLQRAGAALGLQISANGSAELRLRGTPQLVLRDLVAREPSASDPLLRAKRILIAVPWATIRARGAVLDVERIELDSPVVDLAALQSWQAKRPDRPTRVPTLRRGLVINDGSVLGGNWRLERLQLALPQLLPQRPVSARANGRYVAASIMTDFNLRLALARPRAQTGAAAIGQVVVTGNNWRLPAWVRVTGPLRIGDAVQITPLRSSMSARYQSGGTQLRFALGLNGPLRWRDGVLTLAPTGAALRGEDGLPSFDAHGALAWGERLSLRLQGQLPHWNAAWPTLPAPLAQSDAPLPFRLNYLGRPDFSDIIQLQLQREQAQFDGQLRLPAVLAWSGAKHTGSPLPPIHGRFSTPELQISGARLQGVEVEIDDTTQEPANISGEAVNGRAR